MKKMNKNQARELTGRQMQNVVGGGGFLDRVKKVVVDYIVQEVRKSLPSYWDPNPLEDSSDRNGKPVLK